MENTTFVYGSELKGSGQVTVFNVVISSIIFTLSTLAVILGAVNLYFIEKLKIFHNAFGWFWASRTVGEILVELNHAGYNAPISFFQLKEVSIVVGMLPYFFFFIGALSSCLMHGILAANRFVAVSKPFLYARLFSTKISIGIIAFTWANCFVLYSVYIIVPCNLISYSPQIYEYVFIKCTDHLDRDTSIVGLVYNRLCLVVCVCSVLVDCGTLARIIYIRKVLRMGADSKNFKRDVRFFKQSAFQNISMIISVIMIVYADNRYLPEHMVTNIVGFNAVVVTHVTNPLSLLIFNPEVRGRLTGRISSTMAESHAYISRPERQSSDKFSFVDKSTQAPI